ncbi:MAG: hypothetical protein IJ542_00050 [Clostridia bacterium]|nr:hypothetical protein [Clostridia bacterium]
MNLPEQYLKNMKEILGADYSKYVESMSKEPVSALRLNRQKADQSVLGEFDIVKKVSFADNGYIIASSKIGKHPYHIAGLVYVQEPSSMLPIVASGLDNEENLEEIKILDLCAAPGGKTGQIAEILDGRGVLVSNEIERQRARILQGNVERMGYKNVIITSAAPSQLSAYLTGQFDYIFVDAPCGGEGMFRKDPSTILEWKQERLSSNAKRQKEILCEANKMLKTGGKLVYSTCTFSPTEDEDVAEWFANEFNYEFIIPTDNVLNATTCLSNNACRRFYPFLNDGEGQFVCVMRKKSEQLAEIRPFKQYIVGKTEQNLLNSFVKDNFKLNFAPNYAKVGDNYCIINQKLQNMLNFMAKIPQINVGVTVGTIEKGRVVPHNNMFSAFGDYAKNKLNLSLEDSRLAKYLHGEELENKDGFSGFVAVCVNGHAVGGARASGTSLKNLFPKGLRL